MWKVIEQIPNVSAVLWDVYGICERENDSDLAISLAKYRNGLRKAGLADLTVEQDTAIRQFIGRHGQKLAGAHADLKTFAATVEQCIAYDKALDAQR